MIKIAVVDDDTGILKRISELLEQKINEEDSIDVFSDSVYFYENYDKWNYDIIFLDIDMPGINGFKIAEALNRLKRQTEIVFVSNLEHLVYDSIKFRPFRFACKSKLTKDIIDAIDAFIIEQNKRQDIFVIRTSDTTIASAVSEIVYFESIGHVIAVKTSDNKMYQMIRDRNQNLNLKSLSTQLESKGFIRIQKSFLLNYRYIYVVKPSEVLLKDKQRILINPHKANYIRTQFQNFIIKEGEL